MPEPDLRAVSSYRYDLPRELIATEPIEPRDASRLLVVPRNGPFAHERFSALPALLHAGDVLVINETKVIRARLRGRRMPGGGRAEVLLLRPLERPRYDPSARRWLALVQPGRRLRAGARVAFGDAAIATVEAVHADGVREIALDLHVPFEDFLASHGEMPLPPYVGPGDEARSRRYQTIFARVPGSVAAPTASLHFTADTFAALRERGVIVVPLVLDVGLGTFRPMSAERLEEHEMHAERYSIEPATAQAIADARARGSRIVAAGTTVVRALESAARADGMPEVGEQETGLFIAPGYRFRTVDALVTNFHLPESTLLVLVSAFGGYERVTLAYRAAIAERYRFYSFGDAMFIEKPMSS